MPDGQVKAIELQGIVRNRTKIGVQDGQAEDLLNLRFVNGAWRTSGNGRQIDFQMGASGVLSYSQLYVHTNIYRHLLGVHTDTTTNVSTLYWFADIESDGVTFTPLATPIALTTVHGDLWISQTGHLLTVIDGADDFEYFVFKTGTNEYVEVKVDTNGKADSRKLYPFGEVHFNCYCPSPNSGDGYVVNDIFISGETTYASINDAFGVAVEKMKERNRFCQPFLALAAIRLYDDSYIYASNPIYLHPREYVNNLWEKGEFLVALPEREEDLGGLHPSEYNRVVHYTGDTNETKLQEYGIINGDIPLPFTPLIDIEYVSNYYEDTQRYQEILHYLPQAIGSDLVIDISDLQLLSQNNNVIKSLCVFVTQQIPTRAVSTEEFVNNQQKFIPYQEAFNGKTGGTGTEPFPFALFGIGFKKKSYVIDELIHSPFYLLREYSIEELQTMSTIKIVDITTSPEYDGLLKYIVERPRLTYESTSRSTYLPKVSYMYNGRLHIANYKTYPFFGYPIDLFHLHNHSVKVQANSWFPNDTTKKVLPNLVANNDDYLQYPKETINFATNPPSGLEYFAYIQVTIDSSQGEQKVVRYVAPYDYTTAENGRADFVESLNPLLTYPDARAKAMRVVIYRYQIIDGGGVVKQIINSKSFTLKPHPYLNIAYYIDPELKPIDIDTVTSTGSLTIPAMQNIEEHFPNGLKVSKTDNPLFFPVENAYQVGSSEIVALCSNAIAVGTGQTGSAPLYVFCKDGVYALFVDDSGQMAYPNSRILARDVVNNPRSVTPTDQGVAFTTDRGLMMISGEQVQEIGEPAEGDVFRFFDSTSVDYIKTAKGAMSFVAQLPPETLCDGTDFLTYLTGAIINYNHNERELMISNPQKNYTYVLDREGNWSRRDYTAAQYVNNYPTSYRVSSDGHFYKVDEEGTNNTPLEQRKEADNKFFYLSNVVKLDSISFKRAQRFVLRGQFETIPVATGITPNYIGCYVFGSYDGRKWGLLGIYEKTGSFTDIGCTIERTDMRFFRVCLAGQVTGKSRIDYMEISSTASVLGAKIR